jgi:hypothetical protein
MMLYFFNNLGYAIAFSFMLGCCMKLGTSMSV